MPTRKTRGKSGSGLSRRSFLAASALAGGALLSRTSPGNERDWSGATPVRYPDADVIQLDPRFARYKLGNAAIERLHTDLVPVDTARDLVEVDGIENERGAIEAKTVRLTAR